MQTVSKSMYIASSGSTFILLKIEIARQPWAGAGATNATAASNTRQQNSSRHLQGNTAAGATEDTVPRKRPPQHSLVRVSQVVIQDT